MLMTKDTLALSRRQLEMQGFLGLTDSEIVIFEPWLKLAPALCMLWAHAASAMQSPAAFVTLALIAAAGAVMPQHPFDLPYNLKLRHLFGTPRLPRYGTPRRFACAVASVWLAAAGAAFAMGLPSVGVGLGIAFVFASAVPTFTGFCIPSWIFGKLFGDPATKRRDESRPAGNVIAFS